MKFLFWVAALLLTLPACAQIGGPPPPPPLQTVESMATFSKTVATGTVSAYDPSPYSQTMTIRLQDVLKGDKASEIKINTTLSKAVAEWKRDANLVLVATQEEGWQQSFVVNLSDPHLTVLDQDFRIIRDSNEVLERLRKAIKERSVHEPPKRFNMVLPLELVKEIYHGDPLPRYGLPFVEVPVDEHLENLARKALRSKDYRRRLNAIQAFQQFPAKDNEALLNQLLQDPEYEITKRAIDNNGIEDRHYMIRQAAYEALHPGLPGVTWEKFTKSVSVLDTMPEVIWLGNLTDQALDVLERNRNLKSLDLDSAPVTSEQMEKIGHLSGLKSLRLSQAEITDEKLNSLVGLQGLTKLELDRNPITDKSAATLGQLKGLKTLDLSSTQISDRGLSVIHHSLPHLVLKPETSDWHPLSLLRETKADCENVVYELGLPGGGLPLWSTTSIGRLTGSLQWSKTPSHRDFIGPFGQQSVTLKLLGLAEHKNVTISFDLFLIGSWDGDGTLGPGPDIMDIRIPNVGTALHSSFFNNTEGDASDLTLQSYPDPYSLGRHKGYTGAWEIRSLGFIEPWDGVNYHRDAVYRLSYTFAHTGSEFEIVFTGMTVPVDGIDQLTSDENWGISKLVVKTD